MPNGMALDNTILHPIPFVSASLRGAEQRYSNIKCEALGILHGLEKVSPLLFQQRGTCHHQPQTVCIHV